MISVIIPVYNTEKYLPRCIESVLAQTYRNLDIIIVDDGSPDNSGKICDEYAEKDSRVRVFHKENGGLSSARNFGLEKACEKNSEYIGFVDSDDWIEPEMYEQLLKALQEAGADIAICGYVRDADGKPNYKIYRPAANTVYDCQNAIKANLEKKINNTVWNKLYKTTLFDGIEFPKGKTFEDIATFCKVLYKAEKTVTLAEPFYHWEINPDSITHGHTMNYLIDYWNAYKSRYDFFSEFKEKEIRRLALMDCARGISRVWKWAYSNPKVERAGFSKELHEITKFAKDKYPLFGFSDWPFGLKISILFAHSDSELSLASAYLLKKLQIRNILIKNKIINSI